MTKPNLDFELLHKDIENQTKENLDEKYPGFKIDDVHNPSEAELEELAGGAMLLKHQKK